MTSRRRGWRGKSSCFNPHARVGRDGYRAVNTMRRKGFNPHARVGRDKFMITNYVSKRVSIHTPVWGVTELRHLRHEAHEVSIHTPVWGVTGATTLCRICTSCFNPHARVGRDRLCFYDMCFSALIGVKCESLGLHLQKYSFFIEFASNILIIKWCERIGISALLMVLVYIIRSALKLKELSIPMCSTFPSQ